MTRYAIYFTPPEGSALARFGAKWIGRDAFTGEAVTQRPIPGMTPERLAEAAAFPRRYGFHATLKAPFELAEDKTETDLIATLEAFAAHTAPFDAPPLALRNFHGFLTLMLSAPSEEVAGLARACVEAFEPFRAPLSAADRERRLKSPLTERQIAYLDKWGFPYIFEEFSFHMTLTSRLRDKGEVAAITKVLEVLLPDLTAGPLRMDGIGLFLQSARDAPFTVLKYAGLTG